MDSKGRIGYTNSRGIVKKGERNAEQEALFQKVQKKKRSSSTS